MEKRKRFHSTFDSEVMDKMERLKKYYNLRYINDLIEKLVNEDFEKVMNDEDGGNL